MVVRRRWGSGQARWAQWFRVVFVAVALVLLVLPSTPSTSALADDLLSTPSVLGESGDVLLAATQTAVPASPTELESFVLDLLNQARLTEGLPSVGWDPVAAVAARQHADELVQGGYIAHWDRQGRGPSQRYNEAGGTAFVMENLGYGTGYQDDAGLRQFLHDTTRAMMEEAPPDDGHRRNILDRAHTGVGVGIASANGRLAVAQEFTNQYATLEQPPTRAAAGQTLTLVGATLPGYRAYAVQVSSDPAPAPMTIEQLTQTHSYPLAAPYQTLGVQSQDEHFAVEVRLDRQGGPSLYTLLLWVLDPAGQPVPASLVTVLAD
jgi:uncharacterized protein YkwD